MNKMFPKTITQLWIYLHKESTRQMSKVSSDLFSVAKEATLRVYTSTPFLERMCCMH